MSEWRLSPGGGYVVHAVDDSTVGAATILAALAAKDATIERLHGLLREVSVCFADQWNWDDLGHDQQDAITAIAAELKEGQ